MKRDARQAYAERVLRKLEAPSVFQARTLDVVITAETCALHFHAGVSTTVVHLPLAEFIHKARGDRDANMRSFPAAAPGHTPAPPRGWGRRRQLPPGRLDAYRAARVDFEAGLPRKAAALKYGVNENSFAGWLVKTRRREAAQTA